MQQLDLFQWADGRRSNVIMAQWRFQARAIAFVRQVMATNVMPPHIDGKIITAEFRRERSVA